MSPPIDIARRVLFAAWVVVIGGLVLLALGSWVAPLVGQQPFVIRGPSMTPAIPVGSLVFARETAADQIASGDVITLAAGNGTVVTHRVIRVAELDGTRHFETKGDANTSPDPVLVAPGQVAGVVDLSVPIAGYALAMLSTPSGLVSVGSLLLASLMAIWFLDDLATDRATANRGQVTPDRERAASSTHPARRRADESLSRGRWRPRQPRTADRQRERCERTTIGSNTLDVANWQGGSGTRVNKTLEPPA
ncbi:MAG: signal peptidase I [Candidatus Limnocylindrales bacterium]|nr:signal peptidase I [Candidatus Limnocylindrales bacterium]